VCYFNLGLPFPGKGKAENNIFFCNLNERKLHKYPGFNAPCPPGVVDVRIILICL